MKKTDPEENMVNIERNPWLLLTMVLLSGALCWYAFTLFSELAGMAFAIAIPAIVLSFHTLWMLLNPFARIYSDKAELRQSWLHNKDHYFNDLVGVGEHKGRIFVTYSDGEQESLALFGIRKSHRRLLRENFRSHIEKMREKKQQ